MKTEIRLLPAAVILFALNLQFSTAFAQTPSLLNFQGRIVADGVSFNGAGQFEFALVNSNGSATFWSNDGTSSSGGEPTTAISLTLTNGLYSVLLGDTTLANMTQPIDPTLFTNSDVRLRVWFNDGTHGFEQLSPDQRIAAVSYALVAGSASSVSAQNITGTISLAQLPAGVVTNGASGVNISGTFSGNGAGVTNLSAAALPLDAALLDGNQTFTGTNSFTANVGIGTASPRQQLSVGNYLDLYSGGMASPTQPSIRASSGNNLILNAVTNGGVFFNYDGGSGAVYFYGGNSSNELAVLTRDGNFGIGTNNPKSALDVNGDIHASGQFIGNGGGLTNLSVNASQINGTVALGQLPASVVTNGASGVNISGSFIGNGGGLTNTVTAGNYLYAYNDLSSDFYLTNSDFQDVKFDSNGPLNGWTHTPGTASFICAQAGLYLVQSTISVQKSDDSNGEIIWHAVLNDVEVSGSLNNSFLAAGFPTSSSCSFIISANSGDVLKIQLNNGYNDYGNWVGDADLTIIRIQ